MGMIEDLHPNYDMYQMYISNADTGHAGAARDRTYVIASRAGFSSCKEDPYQMLNSISKKIQRRVRTEPQDYCVADPWEVSLEAMSVINKRGADWSPCTISGEMNLSSLLTEREAKAVQKYEEIYMQRYPRPAAADKNLCLFLGDDPSWSLTWSATSKRIPTLRMNQGKLWYPSLRRWLVPRERLCTLGWPVTAELAEAMRC